MSTDSPAPQHIVRGTGLRYGELVVALGVLALAIVVFWQTFAIPISPIYAKVGPTVMPLIAAAGLGLLSLALLVSAFRGGWQSEEDRQTSQDWLALAWVAGGLALNVALIGPAGFTPASIVMFVCVARAFGSRRPLRDASIAAAFALIAYFGFAKTLTINIGGGIVEQAVEQAYGWAAARVGL
jgi:putative tricarboxylic transport membrane protein